MAETPPIVFWDEETLVQVRGALEKNSVGDLAKAVFERTSYLIAQSAANMSHLQMFRQMAPLANALRNSTTLIFPNNGLYLTSRLCEMIRLEDVVGLQERITSLVAGTLVNTSTPDQGTHQEQAGGVASKKSINGADKKNKPKKSSKKETIAVSGTEFRESNPSHSSDLYTRYLQSISHVLLSRAEEKTLAREAQAGALAERQIKLINLLKSEETTLSYADFCSVGLLFDIDLEKLRLLDEEENATVEITSIEEESETTGSNITVGIRRLFYEHLSRHGGNYNKEMLDIVDLKTDLQNKADSFRVDDMQEVVKTGNKARDRLIRQNLRLVVHLAKGYSNRGLPLLDIIQEGNMGLMKAVDRFDPERGKLSNYASWWIKQHIKRAIADQARTIRIPIHMIDKISKMWRVIFRLQEELGRQPTAYDLAEELDIPVERINAMMTASMHTTSLDAPISDDGNDAFIDTTPDPNAQMPGDQLVAKDDIGNLGSLFQCLDEREKKIITVRFGLDGNDPKTLEEVGQEFGVTRERIRQLQNIALRKLLRILRKNEASLPEIMRRSSGKRRSPMRTNSLTNDVHSIGVRRRLNNKSKTNAQHGKPRGLKRKGDTERMMELQEILKKKRIVVF